MCLPIYNCKICLYACYMFNLSHVIKVLESYLMLEVENVRLSWRGTKVMFPRCSVSCYEVLNVKLCIRFL